MADTWMNSTSSARGLGRPGGRAKAKRAKRAPALSEQQVQRAVAKYLDYALPQFGALWFHPANGGLRDVRVAQKLKAEGVKPGVADIIIIWDGRCIAIELKAQKGRQSPAQKDWADALTLAGGCYKVCRSVDEVEEFLDAAGLPLRARTKIKPIQEEAGRLGHSAK